MKWIAAIIGLAVGVSSFVYGAATAQQAVTINTDAANTNPLFWCDASRFQVLHERDASLAQIEVLKLNNAVLAARVKELEVVIRGASTNAPAVIPKETKPNE